MKETELEWARKVLAGEIKVMQGQDNLARAIAAHALGELLGKEPGCVYCNKGAKYVEDDTCFVINGNHMRVYLEGKAIGGYKIRRCPICGRHLE